MAGVEAMLEQLQRELAKSQQMQKDERERLDGFIAAQKRQKQTIDKVTQRRRRLGKKSDPR